MILLLMFNYFITVWFPQKNIINSYYTDNRIYYLILTITLYCRSKAVPLKYCHLKKKCLTHTQFSYISVAFSLPKQETLEQELSPLMLPTKDGTNPCFYRSLA